MGGTGNNVLIVTNFNKLRPYININLVPNLFEISLSEDICMGARRNNGPI